MKTRVTVLASGLNREDLTQAILGSLKHVERNYLTIHEVDLLAVDLRGIRRPERARAVAILRVAGLSSTAISKAIGVSDKNVRRALRQVERRVKELTSPANHFTAETGRPGDESK